MRVLYKILVPDPINKLSITSMHPTCSIPPTTYKLDIQHSMNYIMRYKPNIAGHMDIVMKKNEVRIQRQLPFLDGAVFANTAIKMVPFDECDSFASQKNHQYC